MNFTLGVFGHASWIIVLVFLFVFTTNELRNTAREKCCIKEDLEWYRAHYKFHVGAHTTNLEPFESFNYKWLEIRVNDTVSWLAFDPETGDYLGLCREVYGDEFKKVKGWRDLSDYVAEHGSIDLSKLIHESLLENAGFEVQLATE